jgi:hypothetical protein
VLAAVFVQPQEDRPNPLEWRQAVERGIAGAIAIKKSKSFFSERVEAVVFRWEISVDGRRAVLDALGDLANRDVLVAVSNKIPAALDGATNRPARAPVS